MEARKTPNYREENLRRKKAIDKENEFLKDNFIDATKEPLEVIPDQNQQTQIEKKSSHDADVDDV